MGLGCKMMIIHWPQVIVVSAVCYLFILINLPFNPIVSTVFLFALIAYWSRLPGVGIPSPFLILYLADFVDLFSLIVAINLGGFYGAIFSVFGNMGSRLAGITPYFSGVTKDTIIQFFICLMIPLIYNVLGKDIFATMIAYTIIRRIGFIILWFVYPDLSFAHFWVLWFGVTFASLTINAFYARFFGPYFDNLLQAGVAFNWPLFLFATVMIVLGKIYFFGTSRSKYLDQKTLLRFIFKKLIPREEKEPLKASLEDEKIVSEAKAIFDSDTVQAKAL